MDKLAVILDEGIASAWRRWVETVNATDRTPQSRREVFDQMRGYFLEQREEMRQAALCWLRETCGASPPADLGLPTRLRLTNQGWTAVNGASLH
jgi:hypothetical protein